MFYRIRQFIQAFAPRIDSNEIKWAYDQLTPKAYSLFRQQSLPEQRHALDVAKSLISSKHNINSSDFKNLLTAALLHDCGKSLISIRLWQRVYIVLIQKMPCKSWIEKGPHFLASPLLIASHHPTWGEHLALKAGLNTEICRLIREHHNPQTELGRLLAKADNAH